MAHANLTRRASLGLALGAVCAPAARAADSPGGWDAVDRAARKLIADRASPGVSISVRRQGRFVYSKGFGLANLETDAPTTARSIYKIGSITKQFTAAAVLLLAEDGKLSIDDNLSRFFPDFPRSSEITLRQMLTHTSGMGNYTADETPQAFMQQARLDYDADALYRLMLKTNPLYPYEPGTVYAYSNTAYVLLGLIVEKVGGEPYGAFYKRRLFDPAGLADTAVDDAAQVVPRRSSGYSPREGADGQFENASFISMTIPGGAGSIRSTSEDLCLWHEALFGSRILKPASLQAMITPHRLADGRLPLEASEPGAPGDPKPIEYGFGLATVTMEGRRAIGHHGGINGFASGLETFPSGPVSFSILLNTDGGSKLGPDYRALQDAVAAASIGA